MPEHSATPQMNARQMIMRQPATRWQDALPTGNGPVGAMMYGHICDEQILINHEANWYRAAQPKMVDLSDLLPRLRDLIERGAYQEAELFLDRHNTARGGEWRRTDPYQPVCDLRIITTTDGPFRAYRRGLDLTSGLAWTRWADKGREARRDLFCSRADDVIVLRVQAQGGVHPPQRFTLEAHDGGRNLAAGGWSAPPEPPPTVYEQRAEGEWLTLSGRFDTGQEFGAVSKVVAPEGALRQEGDALVVDAANRVLVLIKAFAGEPAATALPRLRDEIDALEPDFEALFSRHAALHSEIAGRMQLDLPAGPIQPNEDMLLQAYDGDVPTALVQTMFDYGRHLLICSSREGGWPANLQGVWNGDYVPAWSSDYHNDENIQMNYWQALPGSMPEVALPVFDYYCRFLDDYQQNARLIYGCRGILVPIAQTTHGLMYPGLWVSWTGAAGWLGQLFYDYYLFTGDRDFLARRAVPWLEQVALFYEDFLFYGADGRLVFSPSHSPENVPAREGASRVTVNATMDVAICRETLSNLCQAYRTLGLSPERIHKWEQMLGDLPPYEVNEDGALREWLHPDLPDNYHHRHQSHIYGLFPGIEITEERAPEIYAACRVAIEKRLVIGLTSQSGWSMAHMANVYARLGDGDRALECIEILTRSSTGPNLLTYHNDWRRMGLSLGGWGAIPPFQIDANFGVTAAVLEMLIYSRPGIIKILPALPAKWPTGSARGISCRGGMAADLEWDIPQGKIEVVLNSAQDGQILLRLPITPVKVTCRGGEAAPSDLGPSYRRLTMREREPLRLSIQF